MYFVIVKYDAFDTAAYKCNDRDELIKTLNTISMEDGYESISDLDERVDVFTDDNNPPQHGHKNNQLDLWGSIQHELKVTLSFYE